MINENYRLVTKLRRSSKMHEILTIIAMSKIPIDSMIIKVKIGIWQSNIIRVLNELSKIGAIDEVTKEKRGRMYVATDKGKWALKIIEELSPS